MNDGAHAGNTRDGASRLEPQYFAIAVALPDASVPPVVPQPLVMRAAQPQASERGGVRAQLDCLTTEVSSCLARTAHR